MEETPFLVPVQRVVGGVEVEDDLRRRRGMRVEKDLDEQRFDLRPVIGDLVIARGLRPAQLQPVQRRFARQGRAIRAPRFQLAGQDRHHRVMAQIVVVDQILVAQRNPKHPLPNQGGHRVLNQIRRAVVGETAGKPLDQPDRPGRWRRAASLRRPRSSCRRRTPPPPPAPQPLQNQTDLRYTLSASGFPCH